MKQIKVCLDAGHYAKVNRSPANKTYYESEAMWKLHLLLKAELEAFGISVITTRPKQDQDLSLWNRGQKAKGCNLFLSLHSNAVANSVNENVDYPVALCYSEDDKIGTDEVSRELGGKLAKVVEATMGTAQKGRIFTKKIDYDRNGNGFLDDEWYGVLHSAKQVGVVGILMEHSFHTQTKATNWLLKDDNLKKLAKAEAATIAEYYGVKTQSENKTLIMGNTVATAGQMATYCLKRNANPKLVDCSIYELAQMFLDEGAKEGVRGDIAFAQACLETGNFAFGGDVDYEQNNFSGLGATGNGVRGNEFDTPLLGVRAQIQHLKAYASTDKLNQECVDIRFKYVKRGTALYVEWLGIPDNPNGTGWAAGNSYGVKILNILSGILSTAAIEVPPVLDWLKEAVNWAKSKKIIVGNENGDLMLDKPLTRGEFCIMLYRYYNLK
ncbi:N-acetylmuramoyl-L-alanine amidase [Anaerovorax sp. IOR16]|uniref:N-acetylmuramoyl-L-alanine amidase n=1 Tax=Anaerovorax sp. IOR16 TaxID=2773458 RepID=UPI0019CF7CF8|nr:N-acetylmuramoyl-L-alanine amidase [Anaerovorax sp. IOR16]